MYHLGIGLISYRNQFDQFFIFDKPFDVALRTFVDDSSMLFSLTVQTARSTLWSIIEWSHFNFISCLRQLFYVTQIDDLFRFVTNLLSRRDSICIYFFLGSFLFFFFELERHFEGQDFWLKFFSWRSVYLISSIRYQFDPDIWCRFYWFCYLFLFFRNKIGIFWFLCHYGAILGLKILFWI